MVLLGFPTEMFDLVDMLTSNRDVSGFSYTLGLWVEFLESYDIPDKAVIPR